MRANGMVDPLFWHAHDTLPRAVQQQGGFGNSSTNTGTFNTIVGRQHPSKSTHNNWVARKSKTSCKLLTPTEKRMVRYCCCVATLSHLLRRQLPLVHDGSRAEAAHVEALRVRYIQHRDRVCLLRGRLNKQTEIEGGKGVRSV